MNARSTSARRGMRRIVDRQLQSLSAILRLATSERPALLQGAEFGLISPVFWHAS